MTLRLLADDLTGALDSAAQFCARFGAVPVHLSPGAAAGDAAALDIATRDLPAHEAVGEARRAAPFLRGARTAYLKIDSLLRGAWAEQLAAVLGEGGFRRCILAPAFPAQGRITVGGIQKRIAPDGARLPLGDLAATLAAAGLTATRGGHLDNASVRIFDAESDDDLAAAVQTGRALPGATLWCGSAGLAQALSARPAPRVATLAGPVLAIIGTAHPASQAQVEAAAATLPRDASIGLGAGADNAVSSALSRHGTALVSFPFPPGTTPAAARDAVVARLAHALPSVPAPATLVAAGGETLRAICDVLGAQALAVAGEIEPGIPVSTMLGGAWDGITVVTKSGAFGRAATLAAILRRADRGPISGG